MTLIHRYVADHGSGGAFSLAALLGLLTVLVSVVLGWLLGRWWAVLVGLIAIPEWFVLEAWAGDDDFPLNAAPIAALALGLAVFISLGVMTRKRDVIARRANSPEKPA